MLHVEKVGRPYATHSHEGWQGKKLRPPHRHHEPHDAVGQQEGGFRYSIALPLHPPQAAASFAHLIRRAMLSTVKVISNSPD